LKLDDEGSAFKEYVMSKRVSNEQVLEAINGLTSAIAGLVGQQQAAAPAPVAQPKAEVGSLAVLGTIRNDGRKMLSDADFVGCFSNRLAKAKEYAVKNGRPAGLRWVYSNRQSRDMVLYGAKTTASGSNETLLAIVHPDGRIEPKAPGVGDLVEALANAA
jgi:hypothetical protein